VSFAAFEMLDLVTLLQLHKLLFQVRQVQVHLQAAVRELRPQTHNVSPDLYSGCPRKNEIHDEGKDREQNNECQNVSEAMYSPLISKALSSFLIQLRNTSCNSVLEIALTFSSSDGKVPLHPEYTSQSSYSPSPKKYSKAFGNFWREFCCGIDGGFQGLD
jgi:hypothetical protein